MTPRPLPPRRRHLGSRFLGVLTAVLAMAVAYVVGGTYVLVGPLAPARAETAPIDAVRIEITTISPRIATPGDTVTLSGTVENTSGETLTGLQAYFWRDQELRTTRAALEQESLPVGARYLPTFQDLGPEGTLAPRDKVSFTVTAPVSQLDVPARDGVTLVGVQIRGSDQAGYRTLARARAWLPIDVGGVATPVEVASVVALTSSPSRLAPGLFVDDHLAAELASGGRLDLLLRAAGEPGRTYLIDPALLLAVMDMSDGYALADGTEGTGRDAAGAWLQRFDALSTTGYRLPYAATDIDLVGNIDRAAILADAADPTGLPGDLPSLPLAVWPADGALTEPGLAALESLDGLFTVLAGNVARGPSSTDGRTVVGYDTSALVTGPEDATTSGVQLRQATAATTFLDAVQDNGPQVRLITTAAEVRADAADGSTRTPLSSLPATVGLPTTGADLGPTDWTGTGHGPTVAAATDDREGLASMFTDPELGVDLTSHLVASLASTQWEAHPDRYEAFRSWEREQSTSILYGEAVSITARPVLLTAQQDIQFPVTVTNNLPVPVSVRLAFESENAERLSVPAIDVESIGAGEAIGVIAVPEVHANGRYTVVAHLTTPTGRPIGRPLDIEVEATQAGRVGWILMIVSGIVVIGTTVLRIKQVRAERSKA